jgi:hypothetical protein
VILRLQQQMHTPPAGAVALPIYNPYVIPLLFSQLGFTFLPRFDIANFFLEDDVCVSVEMAAGTDTRANCLPLPILPNCSAGSAALPNAFLLIPFHL